MEDKCSFFKLVGGVCGSNARFPNDDIIPLPSCNRTITSHVGSCGISTDISSEIELILARASIFSLPRNLSAMSICPAHRSSLGIGWRRGADRCRVPAGLSKHAKKRKAERGVQKNESKELLRATGVFIPVGLCKSSCILVLVWLLMAQIRVEARGRWEGGTILNF